MSKKDKIKRDALLKRLKLTIAYAKAADESDIIDYLNNVMDNTQCDNLVLSLNDLDDMFNHAKPSKCTSKNLKPKS